MCKSFLTLDKKIFDDVINLIYSKCAKINNNGVYISGAVLNCIFCFFSVEKKQKIQKETDKIYNKINEQRITDNSNRVCVIRTPIIYDKKSKKFVFANNSDIKDEYLPFCLAAVNFHETYAYYQLSGITYPKKKNFFELPSQEKRNISKHAISKTCKADIVVEFYNNLFDILQLDSDGICDYIQCFEMLFFLLDNECTFCKNISNTMKKEAVNIFNSRKRVLYANNENEYFIYNVFIQAMNKLDQKFVFEIDKLRTHRHL